MSTNIKKSVFLILISAFIFQLSTNNFIISNDISKISYCETSNLLKTQAINKTPDAIIKVLEIPVFPEISNLKCLNTIIQTSNSEKELTISIAQNQLFFDVLLNLIVFGNLLIFFKTQNKKYIYMATLLLLNAYLLFIAINKISFLVYLVLISTAPLLSNYLTEFFKLKKIYPFYFIVILSIFGQFYYVGAESMDWDIYTFMSMGQDIGRGYLPYENQFELKPVLLFYVYFLLDNFSTQNLPVFRLLNSIFIIVPALFAYKTLRISSPPEKALSACVLFVVTVFIEYYGSVGFAELYALLFISISFYLIEREKKNNYFIIGLLVSISTLLSLGSVFFFFSILLNLLINAKTKIRVYICGFIIPHLFFLIVYYLNNLLTVYIQANLFIPLSYTQKSLGERIQIFSTGLIDSLKGISEYNFFLFIIFVIIIFSAVMSRLNFNKGKLKSYNYFLFASLLSYFFSGRTNHHLIFTLYFFIFLLLTVDKNVFRKLISPLLIMVLVTQLFSISEKSINNIVNFSTLNESHTVKNLANYLSQEYDFDSVLALNNTLILYYLDLPNDSYVNHPANIFNPKVNIYLPATKSNDQTFERLLSNSPDIVICNENVYEFCTNIDNYKKLDKFKDIGVFIRE
tara:strand:+ start:7396 stop:9282 length:1887 start_codon:yes stop_codon:yes gene_type:complete